MTDRAHRAAHRIAARIAMLSEAWPDQKEVDAWAVVIRAEYADAVARMSELENQVRELREALDQYRDPPEFETIIR